MPLPIAVYGAADCDDTQRTCAHLQARGLPFRLVNIDHDPEAERFVIFVNGGFRSTPTLVIGDGRSRMLLTEPTNALLDEALASVQKVSDQFTA